MSAQILNVSSMIRAPRRPQAARILAAPNALPHRRHRYRRNPCGPSLMALSPLDAFFDLSPSQLLETEEFMGMERARPMAVDFVEDKEGFQIKADIPGVAKQDIKLDIDHNVVTISAKRSSQSSTAHRAPDAKRQDIDSNSPDLASQGGEDKILQNDANVLRYERFDSFQSRSFRVPKTADLSTISAKYADGVLTVDIKKRDEVMEDRRTIDIA